MRAPLLALATLGLAACSQAEPHPEQAATEAPATPRPSLTPTPSTIAVVPDKFQGIWDYEKGSCDPASDMRTEIAERGITFYESHGAVTALTVQSPNVVTVDLAMTGEGEKWSMRRTFTLSTDGSTLTPTGGGDTGEPMKLKRCA